MATLADRAYPEAIDGDRVQGTSFHDILFALRRHRLLIFACTAIGSTVGAAVLLSLPPTYSSESVIVLDARRPRVVDLPSLVAEQTTNPEVAQLRSEVDVLQNEDLANRVIDRLALRKDPDFQPHESLLSTLRAKIEKGISGHLPWLAENLPMLREKHVPGAVEAQQVARAYALQVYREHLGVANDGRSYVIRIQFRSHNPQVAANIVNTHVQLYLSDQIRYKQEIGKQASTWLTKELSNLQSKLRASEEAVQRFREDNQIVQSGDTTLLSQQLTAVNAQIPVAETELANREARLKHARELLQRNSLDTQSDVLESALIQRLREEEATLTRRQAELQAVFGERHPSLVMMKAELHDMQAQIGLAVDRVIKGLQNEVQVARGKRDELRNRLVELERRTVVADRAEGKLHDLRREVAANSSLIEVLLNRYKQVSAQEEIQQPDARVVSAGMPAVTPSFPKLTRHLPIIFGVSLLFGGALAFFKELMRRGFKGSHEVEVECDLPSLGSVPMVPRAWPRVASPHDLVIDHPRSNFAEAISYVRNSIQASGINMRRQPKTFLVTSSLPHEGKSVLAVSLARSFAHSGKRTLLIDCDLRNSSMRRMIQGETDGVCISRVLNREVHWKDAVYKDVKSTLDVVSADAVLAPHDLAASPAVRALIDECRRHYDIIILDSPPITAVADALTLSRWVDATMLAVRWGETPREITKTSLNKLFQSGARLCGAVLTQVDMRRGVFSPAEIEYYHKQNRAYYVH